MSVIINVTLVKRLIELLKDYAKTNSKTPSEFIDDKIDVNISNANKKIYDSFLIIQKFQKFFEAMAQSFWKHYDLKPARKETITALMYTIIFELDTDSLQNVTKIFLYVSYKFCYYVIHYFTIEKSLVEITQCCCNFFDDDFVLDNILYPLIHKQLTISKLHDTFQNEVMARDRVVPKPLTKPVGPSCSERSKSLSRPPLPSANMCRFKRKSISKTVFEGDEDLKSNLEKVHEENRCKAQELYDFAQNNAFRCADLASLPHKGDMTEEEVKVEPIKPTKMPSKRNVVIKHTAASLMREAATLAKDKETEIKKIENLLQSFHDPTTLDALESDIRKVKEQQHIQDIERKHLQGLLTREEAILAKQNLLKLNQVKMEEFKQERLVILDEIDRWKEIENEKIKVLVEKSQNIEKAAIEAGKQAVVTKRNQAREVENETKQLLQDAYIKKQEELARKVKLIQELRALDQVRTLQVKEFDPTESPNFGFLCEMSIAELQERLFLMKSEMMEELERRRKAIGESKMKQKMLIENVKQFIDHSRVSKPKPVPRAAPKLEQTPEIIALRERLDQVKRMRLRLKLSVQRSSVQNS